MLIEKKVGEVVAFRLITGEEVIGKLNKNEGKIYEVSKPLRVQMQPSPDGNGLMPYLAPFVISTPVENLVVHLKDCDVMFTTIPDDGLAKQYTQAVSPILQAKKPTLIT